MNKTTSLEFHPVERLALDRVKDKSANRILRTHNPRGCEPQDCFVCQKHAAICHYHHTPPLSKVAEFFADLPWLLSQVSVDGVWLCPNHHALWHTVNREGERDIIKLFWDCMASDVGLLITLLHKERDCWDRLLTAREEVEAIIPYNYAESRVAKLVYENEKQAIDNREQYCAALERAMRDAGLVPGQTVRDLYAA
jgi:hypothetical protein